jgi:predicted nucleotidyltransferase
MFCINRKKRKAKKITVALADSGWRTGVVQRKDRKRLSKRDVVPSTVGASVIIVFLRQVSKKALQWTRCV